jgi:hypothetical protein
LILLLIALTFPTAVSTLSVDPAVSTVACSPTNVISLDVVTCTLTYLKADTTFAAEHIDDLLSFTTLKVPTQPSFKPAWGSYRFTATDNAAKTVTVEYVVGTGDAATTTLNFEFDGSAFGTITALTVERRPDYHSTMSCEKSLLPENGTMECLVVPRNANGVLHVFNWTSDFRLSIEDWYPGGTIHGYTWDYVRSVSPFPSNWSLLRVADDMMSFRFTFTAPPSTRLTYITLLTLRDALNVTGSPHSVSSLGPCFEFPNPVTGVTRFGDAPSCVADMRCMWCSLVNSLTEGKCAHWGDVETDTTCAVVDYRKRYSIQVSGDSVEADLSVWPHRWAQFFLELPHRSVYVYITLIYETNNRFQLLTRVGQRPEMVHYGNDTYAYSQNTTVHRQKTPPLAATIGPTDFSCDPQLLTSGICNRLYIAVIGDNTPPINWQSSKYSVQVFREFAFDNFSCIEHGGIANASYCDIITVGDTAVVNDTNGKGVIRLVSSGLNQTGAFYYRKKVVDYLGFEARFAFRIYNKTACGDDGFCVGADGFAFILQVQDAAPPPQAMARSPGATLGFACSEPSVCTDGLITTFAIEFDTFWNDHLHDPRIGDPHKWVDGTRLSDFSAPHVGLFVSEATVANTHVGSSTLHKGSSVNVPDFTDGQIHQVRIEYVNSLLMLFIDDFEAPVMVLSYAFETIRDPSGLAFVGFTSSTGTVAQTVDILSFRYCSTIGCIAA